MFRQMNKIIVPMHSFSQRYFINQRYSSFGKKCFTLTSAGSNLKTKTLDFLKTLPYLLVYNFIFILPMIAITIAVYLGISSAEKVSSWRDRNIKFIHLIAGLILVGLGIGMLTNLI